MGEVPSISKIEKRIDAFVKLGQYMLSNDTSWQNIKIQASQKNVWFTLNSIDQMMQHIASEYCNAENIKKWLSNYSMPAQTKSIGLIFAGNIPFVGFHDLLAVAMSGHSCKVKLSSKDDILPAHLIAVLQNVDPWFHEGIQIVSKLSEIDAVIATGSNNTSRYFYQYFRHIPHIIRKNRQSIAILTGQETKTELDKLCTDIFSYYGLGCRSVSKLYLMNDFELEDLFDLLNQKGDVLLHPKYKSNYDYNFALWTLNGNPFLQSASILLRENEDIASRIGSLNYAYYDDQLAIERHIEQHLDQIQCVVAGIQIGDLQIVPFGNAQFPGLNDYADRVDTLQFLTEL